MTSPAGPWVDLVHHVLAHVLVSGPASLFDPRYLAWSRRELPGEAWRHVAEDAPVLAGLAERPGAAEALSAMPRLFNDLGRFRATAARPLEAIGPGDVDDPTLLSFYLGMDRALVELVRCALALAADAYEEAHAKLVEPELALACASLSPWLERACAVMPRLRRHPVTVSHPLGPRGRVFGDRIVVGAPGGWSELAPVDAALQAMHECAVTASSAMGWAGVEREALIAVEQLVRGTEWEAPHAAWKGRLDLSALEPLEGDAQHLVDALRSGAG